MCTRAVLLFLITTLSTILPGCAQLPVDEYAVSDTLEKGNRVSYAIVEFVDKAIARPLAVAYTKVLPYPVQKGITNVFLNIRTADSSINGLLQGKPKAAGIDLARILLNTTLGIGGIFDVAAPMGLDFQEEDFGQTLAVWGYTRTRYVYFPIVGPSTVRDLPGALINRILAPPLIVGKHYNFWVGTLDTVSYRAENLPQTDIRDAAALDPYSFTREAYFQRRKFLIFDGDPPEEDMFDEYFEDE